MTTYVTFTVANQAGGLAQDAAGQANWQPLLIYGNSIRFLHFSLLQQSEFLQREDAGGGQHWRLTFFRGSPSQTSIDLRFYDTLPVPSPAAIGKSIWLPLAANHTPANLDAAVANASLWLRGASTLSANDFREESGRHVAIDSKGIGFLSAGIQEITFKRCLILQALAYAYQQALEDLSQEMITALAKVSLIREIYKKLIMFNAKCFLTYPVDPDGVALPLIWERLREKSNIERVNRELTRQAHDLSQLLAEQAREDAAQQDRNRADTEREKARLAEIARQEAVQQDLNRTNAEKKRVRIVRFWGAIVSACLAAVSILQGLQVPPAQLYDNLRLWKALLF